MGRIGEPKWDGPKWDGPKRAGPNRAATINTDDAACDDNADGAANVKGW